MEHASATGAYPEVEGPEPDDSPALAALVNALEARFGSGLQGVILYGSCLRSGDLFDGVVDLYVLVDGYASAYDRIWLRIGNRLLPPNVHYLEVSCEQRPVRCKYAVLSLTDFERRTGRGCAESYFWGRFAQPVKVVFARTPAVRARLHQALLNAGETLLRAALPVLAARGRVSGLWRGALVLSYSTELRSEGSERAGELAGHSCRFLQDLALALAPRLADCLELRRPDPGDCDWHYRATVTRLDPVRARWAWRLRRVQGKWLSVLRLLKGLFTFDGGLDYIAWKLERHSGRRVEIPDKVRQRPLVHIWGLFWRLYRRGVFR